jgi:phage terminase large subunit
LRLYSFYLSREQSLVEEIEKLKDEDENLWKIYGLGERGKAQDLIYTNWEISDFPPVCEHYRYGVDFGYNHPSALLLAGVRENDVYIRQIIYQTHLTNQDLIDLMIEREVSKKILIRADSAEPDRIREIAKAGFRIEPARKSRAFTKDAIDNLKRRRIHITPDSVDVIKEIKNYRWKKDPKTNECLDEPIKFKDDAMDALKYAIGDLVVDDRLFHSCDFEFERKDLPRQAVTEYAVLEY